MSLKRIFKSKEEENIKLEGLSFWKGRVGVI
jgi:hypothetical protein